jgi:two-component sensor histidine kinase
VVSISLIVTELVISALKHAFPDNRRNGTVAVAYDLADPNCPTMASADRRANQPIQSAVSTIVLRHVVVGE